MLKLNVGETWCLKYSSAACGRFDFKEEIAAANADETCKRREPIQKGYVSLRLASAPCSRTCGCDVLQVATDCRSSTVPAAGDIITLDRHTDTADRLARETKLRDEGSQLHRLERCYEMRGAKPHNVADSLAIPEPFASVLREQMSFRCQEVVTVKVQESRRDLAILHKLASFGAAALRFAG
ncbi:hypothetical protein AK812_SmicGene27105 [Symbiodinium microadriaticum]|uniref:Uncharacterized protein n=1 Tax=Symbiodinium microadriaticum TaxID=2951 RepID=A0A1Q9D7N3_SYMMI|nr:hypothetical protein AK812_SmicGene27105 [Symbiodinium microadriaticum]